MWSGFSGGCVDTGGYPMCGIMMEVDMQGPGMGCCGWSWELDTPKQELER